MAIETILAWFAGIVFISVISSKISDKLAIPVLLIFLVIGMLAGSEGIGGIYFDDVSLAKSIGIVALIFIIFSGGFDTEWRETRGVIWPGVILSTAGVLLTAVIIGFFSVHILKFSMLEGMLLGAIVSSTDAAAVFSVLRSKSINLKPPLKPLLELESGSNDPMAVFLTIGILSVMTSKDASIAALVPKFFLDMGVGAVTGLLMSRFIIFFIRLLKLEYAGLYPIVMMALVLLTYSLAVFLKGNGFLAIYIAGLMLGRAEIPNKRMIMRFHDGLAWLAQIVMFVALGLLVFPSHIVPFIWVALALTFLLMFVARPLSVFLCLTPFKLGLRKKIMVAWVGLRGAVPVILATFPLMAGIGSSETIFNVVFFVVIASVLLQGMSIPLVSKLLKVDAPFKAKADYPIEFEKKSNINADLIDLIVPHNSGAAGKKISELFIPKELLIVLILRNDRYIIPSGEMKIEGGDVLLVLANASDFALLHDEITRID